MSEVTFNTSLAIAMDSATYVLAVYTRNREFLAYWECQNCNHQSAPPAPAGTREEAIEHCEQAIEAHHRQRHLSVEACV